MSPTVNFANSLSPHQASQKIWIQTTWQSDGIHEKKKIEKFKADFEKKSEDEKSMQNYPVGKALIKAYLFDLILYVPSTIFQLCRDGSSCVEPVLSRGY